jgi:DNA-binding CsgD family transcriptional regulator
MEHLREVDVRALLELVNESNAHRSLRGFRQGILPGLRRLVPCEVAAYNEVEPERAFVISDPADALDMFDDAGATLARNGGNHPLIVHYARTRDGRAYKLSDFVTREQLHRLPVYREIFGPAGVEHQIAFTLPSQPTVIIGIALSRDGRSDFAERDRGLLNLVRPALVQAYRNVAAYARLHATLRALARGLADRGEGVVTFGRQGAIEFVSPVARALLEGRFPDWSGRGGRLPQPLADALAAARAASRADGATLGAAPVIVPGEGGSLVARLVPARVPDEPDALLLEARAEPLAVEQVRALGLTGRQAEVLRLVALGSSTDRVAETLGISSATVRKHLEHVYERLGVSSRAAAVATAWAGAEVAGGELEADAAAATATADGAAAAR